MLSLLKETLKEKEKEKSQREKEKQGREQGIEEKICKEKPSGGPDKWMFIAEQLLSAVRETYVRNPADITYQFSRRIATEVIKNRYHADNELLTEGFAIGVYKGVENLIKKILTKP